MYTRILKRRKILFLLFSPLALSVACLRQSLPTPAQVAPCLPSSLMGDALANSAYESFAGGSSLFAQPVTAAVSGTLTEIRLKFTITSSNNIIFGLYTDNGGQPGTLLTSSGSPTLVGTGLIALPVAAVSVTQGIPYWLAVYISNIGTPTLGISHSIPAYLYISGAPAYNALPNSAPIFPTPIPNGYGLSFEGDMCQ